MGVEGRARAAGGDAAEWQVSRASLASLFDEFLGGISRRAPANGIGTGVVPPAGLPDATYSLAISQVWQTVGAWGSEGTACVSEHLPIVSLLS